ncbi:MAG: hypothetical protein MUE99_02685, partial [Chitinophagaceae bacterium]|nr:hypothetical protein [Chitinophagaceae bacterium]
MKPIFTFILLTTCFISPALAQQIGIGTTSPTSTLDINGTIRIRGGSPGAGKVLTSDANGTATWKNE